MRVLALAVWLVGCGSSGSLELTLSLPTQADLRPTDMTTVTVTATPPGEPPMATTSVLAGNAFTAGQLPVGRGIQIDVVLRDVSNRIVGVGEATEPVDISADSTTRVEIPVRRPFVYASSGSALYSFDPTLDPRDGKFQGQLAGSDGARFTVSVGGDRLAVVTNNQVKIITTATNVLAGSIDIPTGVNDATAVPGTHKIALAHGTGIAIVDLDNNTVANTAVGKVDRITVGPASGGTYAFGLVGRVTPPELPPALTTCSGSSSLIAVDVDAPGAATPRTLGEAVSDLAADPDTGKLYATLPCLGEVAELVGDPVGSTPKVTRLTDLERASVLTVSGDRILAAGTHTATPECGTPCTTSTPIVCTANMPQPGGDMLAFVSTGANLVLLSIPTSGGDPIQIEAPARTETIIDTGDLAKQHAQVLKPLSMVPLDLVALPGGQDIGIVARSRYYIEEYDGATQIILPCLDATTSDWLLVDMASASVSQRVRTSCAPIVGASDVFVGWACDTPPLAEQSMFADYVPISIGALFGAR